MLPYMCLLSSDSCRTLLLLNSMQSISSGAARGWLSGNLISLDFVDNRIEALYFMGMKGSVHSPASQNIVIKGRFARKRSTASSSEIPVVAAHLKDSIPWHFAIFQELIFSGCGNRFPQGRSSNHDKWQGIKTETCETVITFEVVLTC